MKYSKQHYINYLNKIINPIKNIISDSNGTPSLGSSAAWYNDISVSVETFARPLWGLVPLWYGSHGDDELRSAYLKGIICGTNPESENYWGICDNYDQRFVEMTAIAYAMLFTPNVVWEPLSNKEKNNLKNWLWQINTHEVCDNNWIFFRILVNTALKHVGEKYDIDLLNKDLSRIDNFYLGNGWYMDGPSHQKDYYISMAIHFYSLIYSYFENDSYAKKFRDRAKLFANDFIYWFADNGAALPYGRSLTYRFAQGSFWSACLLTGIEVFDKGVLKGIITRLLDDWLDAPIFDNGGVLTIGYKYQNLLMAEHYNAPGSPYWGLKIFAFLALNDNDEFWNTEPKPMPKLSDKRLISRADMLVTRMNGEVYSYPAGTFEKPGNQVTAKYLKFVYSTKFGFNVKYSDFSIYEVCGDNMLVFDINGRICERLYNYSFELNETSVVINWSPVKGVRVRTEITPNGSNHTRKHIINSDFDCIAYDGGFAVACRDKDLCTCTSERGFAMAQNRFSYCSIKSDDGEGLIIHASANTNLIYTKTVIPTVKFRIKKGRNEFLSYINAE